MNNSRKSLFQLLNGFIRSAGTSKSVAAILTALLLITLAASVKAQGKPARETEKSPTELINGREAAAKRVIVKFRGGKADSARAEVAQTLDVDYDVELGGTGARLIYSRTWSVVSLIEGLSARADVIYAEPDYVAYGGAPSDPLYGQQWNMRITSAESAWDITHDSPSQTIAVLDSGIDYNHPDLAANAWTAPSAFTINVGGATINCPAGTHGVNLIANTCDPLDDHNHGSHVSGIIGAVGGNGQGIVGVNWRTNVLALKWLNSNNSGFISDAIKAIDAAIQIRQIFGAAANVRVLSNSWWASTPSQALLDAIRRAESADMLFVAIAGNGINNNFVANDNDATPVYPGSYQEPGVMSVAATDVNDTLAYFSNYGAHSVHLAAPGASVFSTIRNGSYGYFNGTSQAAPHVSGAAALLLSRCEMTSAGLKGLLITSTDSIASLAGKVSSGGRLNVRRALDVCLSNPNVIDEKSFFVRQHYVDFLNREPDASGLQFWTNQIASCNGDSQCIDIKRQNVSAAYFLSREFQETGFFVIKVRRAAFGQMSQDSTKRISYQQFLANAQAVGLGFIDGQIGADGILERNKNNYVQGIVNASAFAAKYPLSLTAAQYVDALYQTAGVQPTQQERADAIAAFGSGDAAGRAAALRKIAESNSIKQAEFAPAFVLLQYFGYLRRNPTDPPDSDDSGYQFWLSKLNSFGGDYIRSEMVRSFIVSAEYRKRFGPPSFSQSPCPSKAVFLALNDNIRGYDLTQNGEVVPCQVIAGQHTGLETARSLSFSKNGLLHVEQFLTNGTYSVFASDANGDTAPRRTVSTLNNDLIAIAVDSRLNDYIAKSDHRRLAQMTTL